MFLPAVKKEERQSQHSTVMYSQEPPLATNPSIISQPFQHIPHTTIVSSSPSSSSSSSSKGSSQEYSLIRKRAREDSSSSLYDHKDDSKGSEVWYPSSLAQETPAIHTQASNAGPWATQPTQTRSSLIPDPSSGSPPQQDLLRQQQQPIQHQQQQQQQQEHEDKAHRLPSIKHLRLEPTTPSRANWNYYPPHPSPHPSPTSYSTPSFSPSSMHGRSPLGVTQTIAPPPPNVPAHPHQSQSHSRPSSPTSVHIKESPSKPNTVGFIETTFSTTPQKKTHKRRPANVDKGSLFCHTCGSRNTPEWRRGPQGPATLCNACGLAYAKRVRQEEERAAAAAASPRIEHQPSYDYQVPPPSSLYSYQHSPHLDTYDQVASYLHNGPSQAYPNYPYTPTYEQLPLVGYGYNLRAIPMQQISHQQVPPPHPQVSHSQAQQAPHTSIPSPSAASRAQFRPIQKLNGHTFHQYYPPNTRGAPTYINYTDNSHFPMTTTTTTTTTALVPLGMHLNSDTPGEPQLTLTSSTAPSLNSLSSTESAT